MWQQGLTKHKLPGRFMIRIFPDNHLKEQQDLNVGVFEGSLVYRRRLSRGNEHAESHT